MLFRSSFTFFIASVICVWFLTACQLFNPSNNSEEHFEGITETDTLANILADDPDDWQPRKVSHGTGMIPTGFGVEPAYPNPAGVSFHAWGLSNPERAVCVLTYALPELSEVSLKVNVTPDSTVKVLADENRTAGYYAHYWDLKSESGDDLPNGIYRVFIEVVTNDTSYTSHGDIKIKR